MAKVIKQQASTDQTQPNFEHALEEMETIVQKMENDQLPLHESLAYLKRGIELGKICHRKLDEAEQQVQVLVKKGEDHQLEELSGTIAQGQDQE